MFSIYKKFKSIVIDHEKNTSLQLYKNQSLTLLTYKELLDAVDNLSSHLFQLGVKPGFRVALIGVSSFQWIISFLAINSLQATVVAIDPLLEKDQLIKQIELADPWCVITTEDLYNQLLISLNRYSKIIINYCDYDFKTVWADKNLNYLDDGNSNIAAILFTSGTTGDFKGVELTDETLFFVVEAATNNLEFNNKDNVMCILPAHHVYGLIYTILSPLLVGATVTFPEKVQGPFILQAMQATKPTLLIGVPRIYELFIKKIMDEINHKPKLINYLFCALIAISDFTRSTFDFNFGKLVFRKIQKLFGGKIRYFTSGSAPLSLDSFRKLEAFGFTVIEGYGLTETASCVSVNTPNNRMPHTVGIAPKGVDIKLDRPDENQQGEICVRGPSIMKGYFRNTEATYAVLHAGWLHTGDLGKFSRKGHLIITGRIKEMIVLPSGKKVMANVIEEQYKNIKEINEIAVVGMPLADGGEKVCAAVKLVEEIPIGFNSNQYKELVRAKISARAKELPEWWSIHHIYFVNEIPKTNTLKVKRKKLVEQLIKQQNDFSEKLKFSIELSEDLKNINGTEKIVIDSIMQVMQVFQSQLSDNILISPTISFRTYLGLDSLSKFELLNLLENKLQIEIPIDRFSDIDTPFELIKLIEELIDKKINQPSLTKTLSSEIKVTLPNLKHKPSLLNHLLEFIYGKYFELEVHGKEHLPTEPFILCANHTSHLDGMSLALASGMKVSDFAVLAAKDYFFKNSLSKKLIRQVFNMIPFDRAGTPIAIEENAVYMDHCRRLNKNIILFPEGTRSITGQLQDFKLGAALFADRLKMKIVPAHIRGAYELLPKGRKIPKSGKIIVCFDKPCEISINENSNSELYKYKTYKDFTSFLHKKISNLSRSL